jgi:Type II secretion system (T2SS), protein F
MTPAVSAALPTALRAPLLGAGTVLLLTAVRTLLRRDARARPGDQRGGGLLGHAVLIASRAAAHLVGLRRASDAVMLPVRLAVAPGCWPSRGIAAGVRAAASAKGSSDSPPDLPRLAAGLRLLTALLAAAPVATAAVLAAGPNTAVAAAVTAALAGARIPDVVLVAAARRAVRTAEHDCAAIVDLLAATASAGMALPDAMALSSEHTAPPLAAILRAASLRRAMGDEPGDALTVEARRYGLPILGDVAQAIGRQRRLGVPLGPELTRIAAQMRAEQRATVLRRASRRGPVGTLVVALVIAPVCLAAVIACLVGGLLQGGGLMPG